MKHWRGPAEFAQTPEFREAAAREFPHPPAGTDRRSFLKYAGASLALAGMAGCRRADHRILPYTAKPPEMVPGNPLYYATTFVLGGRAMGMLAETHQGRPTKLEGNPLHPASGGALNAFAQASILDLYDPDRSRQILHHGEPATWEDLAPVLDGLRGRGDVAVLAEDFASPAMDMLRANAPGLRWYEYEPIPLAAEIYDLQEAEVIISLDCDFLGLEDDGVRYQREFAAGRSRDPMNRLYVVEPHLTVTGMAADHRKSMRASAIGQLARALRDALLTGVNSDDPWVRVVTADLRRTKAHAVVLPGRRQSAEVHELAAWMNVWLEARSRYQRPVLQGDVIGSLGSQIEAGKVGALIIVGGNPAYNAPAGTDFAGLLDKVETTICLGLYEDETSALCEWHIPQAHYLESWGDAQHGEALSPIQPMIQPLLGGWNALEIVARVAGHRTSDPYEIVRESFRYLTGDADFETRWRQYLNKGIVTAATRQKKSDRSRRQVTKTSGSYEVCFSGDYSVYDGRFANNGWLQECPDPVTKLTWDNAAVLSPTTAQELDVETGDMLSITVEG
ncbi:MAG: TAT-variant-translocated molybdopterin oxidoreductase, partial [Planctomycetota bacterium]